MLDLKTGVWYDAGIKIPKEWMDNLKGVLAGHTYSEFIVCSLDPFFMKYRRELDFKRFEQAADEESNLVQMVTAMQEIKLNRLPRHRSAGSGSVFR